MTQHAEIVIIGAGPGGYPAAFAAADHGKKVVLVNEEQNPGGVCLQRGCIPSKALLHVAKLIHEAADAAEHGLTFGKPKIDLDKLRAFKNSVIGQLTGGIQSLCKARGVTLVQARATFANSNTLNLAKSDGSTEQLTFDNAVIATGSQPAMPPIFAIGDPRVMDSTGALALEELPKKLLVIGGGYIGLEMGCVYAALGSEVTVVEALPVILAAADRDLVRPLQKRLETQFKAIHVNTKVVSLTASKAGIVAELQGEGVEPKQTFDRVLVSVGRKPNSKNLGLENTKVQIDEKGFLKIDRCCRTADPNILAIGDVAGEPMLAHKATREAKVAIEALVGEPAEFDNIAIPAVVFTDPELAWCGLTETEAKAQERDVKVIRFAWAASGRAQSLARTEGLTKLIVENKTERILGVGIVGAGAGELISEGVLAVETAAVARDLADSIHPHPTLSETLMEAAEAFIGQATHMYRPNR
ncbi:MAG: dihydrolipoamide dehydrogenase [Planctomycetota bacterium]|nr:MAG: dihydrolipoamide dehydrogenase [Planctomycetota bacterium]